MTAVPSPPAISEQDAIVAINFAAVAIKELTLVSPPDTVHLKRAIQALTDSAAYLTQFVGVTSLTTCTQCLTNYNTPGNPGYHNIGIYDTCLESCT